MISINAISTDSLRRSRKQSTSVTADTIKARREYLENPAKAITTKIDKNNYANENIVFVLPEPDLDPEKNISSRNQQNS